MGEKTAVGKHQGQDERVKAVALTSYGADLGLLLSTQKHIYEHKSCNSEGLRVHDRVLNNSQISGPVHHNVWKKKFFSDILLVRGMSSTTLHDKSLSTCFERMEHSSGFVPIRASDSIVFLSAVGFYDAVAICSQIHDCAVSPVMEYMRCFAVLQLLLVVRLCCTQTCFVAVEAITWHVKQ